MVESASSSETTLVAVLFPPEALPVIDIFRALGDFEDNYDIGALDALETRLCGLMNRALAKGIVSDALLLAFGLRRERRAPLDYRPVRSRRGTLDEYRLMALMAATYDDDFHLAAAAASLEILHPQPLVSLAFDIARRLEAASASSKRRIRASSSGLKAVCRLKSPARPPLGPPIQSRFLIISCGRPFSGQEHPSPGPCLFPGLNARQGKGAARGDGPLGTTLVMSYS